MVSASLAAEDFIYRRSDKAPQRPLLSERYTKIIIITIIIFEETCNTFEMCNRDDAKNMGFKIDGQINKDNIRDVSKKVTRCASSAIHIHDAECI